MSKTYCILKENTFIKLLFTGNVLYITAKTPEDIYHGEREMRDLTDCYFSELEESLNQIEYNLPFLFFPPIGGYEKWWIGLKGKPLKTVSVVREIKYKFNLDQSQLRVQFVHQGREYRGSTYELLDPFDFKKYIFAIQNITFHCDERGRHIISLSAVKEMDRKAIDIYVYDVTNEKCEFIVRRDKNRRAILSYECEYYNEKRREEVFVKFIKFCLERDREEFRGDTFEEIRDAFDERRASIFSKRCSANDEIPNFFDYLVDLAGRKRITCSLVNVHRHYCEASSAHFVLSEF